MTRGLPAEKGEVDRRRKDGMEKKSGGKNRTTRKLMEIGIKHHIIWKQEYEPTNDNRRKKTHPKQTMLGTSFFPITLNGRFDCKCKLTVAKTPTEGSKYEKLGAFHQFYFPLAFSKNPDAALSVTSSYNAAVLAGFVDGRVETFLTLEPDTIGTICGASEGAATLMAMLGVIMPDNSMITGFIDSIGCGEMTREELFRMKIQKIDQAKAKAIGAKEANIKLLLPHDNKAEFEANSIPSNVVFVETVGDAIAVIKAL